MGVRTPEQGRRNRLIVAAAKEGHCYAELAALYGLTPPMISIICRRAGFRKNPGWTEEQKQRIRGIARKGKKT
jgi:hypothetical protein